MTTPSSRSALRRSAAATSLFDQALTAADGGGPVELTAHYEDESWLLPVARWCGPADAVDRSALDRLCAVLPAAATVIDIGCGPGRHTAELHARGLRALGVDTSPVAVALAQRRGAPALRANAAGPLPGGDHGWDGALLLDGNLGIGGDPLLLLCRVRDLLRPAGRVLVELDHRGVTDRGATRLSMGGTASRPFPWARTARDGLAAAAPWAGLTVEDEWTRGGRSFALLTPRQH